MWHQAYLVAKRNEIDPAISVNLVILGRLAKSLETSKAVNALRWPLFNE